MLHFLADCFHIIQPSLFLSLFNSSVYWSTHPILLTRCIYVCHCSLYWLVCISLHSLPVCTWWGVRRGWQHAEGAWQTRVSSWLLREEGQSLSCYTYSYNLPSIYLSIHLFMFIYLSIHQVGWVTRILSTYFMCGLWKVIERTERGGWEAPPLYSLPWKDRMQRERGE